MTGRRDGWDPAQYARFEAERSRPFFDLVGFIERRRRCGSSTWDAATAR